MMIKGCILFFKKHYLRHVRSEVSESTFFISLYVEKIGILL